MNRCGLQAQTGGMRDGCGWIGCQTDQSRKVGVGWQINRQTDSQIGCEINRNRWGVGQKVALGQQVGGIGGQSIVGGDGSPGWVVITRLGVLMHENLKI